VPRQSRKRHLRYTHTSATTATSTTSTIGIGRLFGIGKLPWIDIEIVCDPRKMNKDGDSIDDAGTGTDVTLPTAPFIELRSLGSQFRRRDLGRVQGRS
jgi:hypothetical protein